MKKKNDDEKKIPYPFFSTGYPQSIPRKTKIPHRIVNAVGPGLPRN